MIATYFSVVGRLDTSWPRSLMILTVAMMHFSTTLTSSLAWAPNLDTINNCINSVDRSAVGFFNFDIDSAQHSI